MAMSMGDIVATMRLDISQFNQSLNQVSMSLRGLGNSTQMAGITAISKSLTSVGTGLTKAVTLPIVAMGAASVKVASDFEASMSKVQSASGASGEDMKKLEKIAREMGASTVFSAKESADALYYMGLAGWDTNQMMAGLEPVLKMAGAAGIELGRASEIVTDSMNMFSMEASEAGRMTDVLAQAAASTSTDIEGLGESLVYCGTSGAAMGYDIEEVSAMLGKLGDAGIKGSVAGTTLNSMFRDMKKSAEDGAIAIGDTSIKIVDAQGNYRSMIDILADVENATKGMTMEQKNQALSSVWQVEAQKGVNAIMEQGVDSLKKVDNELRNCTGAANEQYEVMQNNLKGTWANLSSALEDFGITIGNILIPILRKLMDSAIEAVDKLNAFAQAHPNITKVALGFMAVLAVIGPLLLGLGMTGLAFAKTFDGIKLIVGGFRTLRTGFLIVKTLLIDTLIPSILGKLIPALSSLWAFLLANPIVLIITAVMALVAGFIYLWNNVDGFKEFWINAWESIKTACSNAWTTIVNWCSNAWNSIVTWWQGLPQFFSGLWEGVKLAVSNAWNSIILAIQTACMNIWNFFTVTIPAWMTAIGEWFNQLPYKIGEALGMALGYIVKWALEVWNFYTVTVPQIIATVVQYFAELPGKIWEWLKQVIDKVTTWGQQTWNKAKETGSNFVKAIVEFFSQLPSRIYNFLSQAIQKVTAWVTSMVSKAKSAGTQFITAVVNYFTQLPGKIATYLSQAISKLASWVTDMASKGSQAASKLISSVRSGLASLPSTLSGIGRNAIQGLWNGMQSIMGGIKSKVKSFCDGLVAGFKKVLSIHSPSRVMRDEVGKQIVAGIGVGMDKEEGGILASAKGMASNLVDTMKGSIDFNTLGEIPRPSNATLSELTYNIDSKQNIPQEDKAPKDGDEGDIIINLNIENFNNEQKSDVKTLMGEITDTVKNARLTKGKRVIPV